MVQIVSDRNLSKFLYPKMNDHLLRIAKTHEPGAHCNHAPIGKKMPS